MSNYTDPTLLHWVTGITVWLVGASYRWRYLSGERACAPRQAFQRSVLWPVYVKRYVGRWLYRVVMKPVITNQWPPKTAPGPDTYGDVPLPPVGSRIPMPPVKAPKPEPPTPPATRIIRDEGPVAHDDPSSW